MATEPGQEQDQDILKQYLMTSTKYHPVPVPARVDRSEAVTFVQERAKAPISKQMLGKLSRLAIFHELTETTEQFVDFLNKRETEPDDYARTATAVTTIAWLGDDKQVANAQRYFQNTLLRSDAQESRDVMLGACDALGAREGTKNVRAWLQKEVARLDEKQQANPTPETRETLARTREFLKFQVPQVDNANEQREKFRQQKSEQLQVQQLVSCYLREAKVDAPSLEYWAAIMLVHLGRRGRGFAVLSAEEFGKVAQRSRRKDRKLQPEIDFKRARSLRAADFFGGTLEDEDQEWLAEQEDHGVDIIALRPNWQYGGGLEQP